MDIYQQDRFAMYIGKYPRYKKQLKVKKQQQQLNFPDDFELAQVEDKTSSTTQDCFVLDNTLEYQLKKMHYMVKDYNHHVKKLPFMQGRINLNIPIKHELYNPLQTTLDEQQFKQIRQQFKFQHLDSYPVKQLKHVNTFKVLKQNLYEEFRPSSAFQQSQIRNETMSGSGIDDSSM